MRRGHIAAPYGSVPSQARVVQMLAEADLTDLGATFRLPQIAQDLLFAGQITVATRQRDGLLRVDTM
jgi:hypothetical protein